MSLKQWENNGWLRPHRTSNEEVNNLLGIVERDLCDSSEGDISEDWKFGIAYNAALKLCTVLLFVSGYRAEKNMAHYRTLQALPLILGKDFQDTADYLNTCRIKRNETEYDFVGGVSEDEANELIAFVKEFKLTIFEWLRKNHSSFTISAKVGPD